MSGPVSVGKSDHWGSRFGFIMAAVGSSVGLGNLWRFPYIAGEMGGSAFILIYLGCILIFGLPVLMAEYALGRHGQRSSIASIRKIVTENNRPTAWVAMGWLGAFGSLLLFSFYIVISAWVFDFIPRPFLVNLLISTLLSQGLTLLQRRAISWKYSCMWQDFSGLTFSWSRAAFAAVLKRPLKS